MPKSFTENTAKKFHEDLELTLAELAEKHGVSLKTCTGRFTDGQFKASVSFLTKSDTGEVHNPYFGSWGVYAPRAIRYLNPGDQIITHNGDTMELMGWNNRKRKDKIALKRTYDGKSFKCSVEYLKSCKVVD
jgi:hypothetical protein